MSSIAAHTGTRSTPVGDSLVRSLVGRPPFDEGSLTHTWSGDGIAIGAAWWLTRAQAWFRRADVFVTCDGRLDDRDGLRDALVALGAEIAPDGVDAELLAASYHAWGTSCFERLSGEFAVCLWDSTRRILVIARDRFGVKPLFYARCHGGIVVSSSLAAIRGVPGVSSDLSDEALGDFLLFGHLLDPGATCFVGIARVPPGSWVRIEADREPVVARYWSLEAGPPLCLPRTGDYVERFQQVLLRAVAERVGTAPVSVTMSGGLDSTSVAALVVDVRGRDAARCQAVTAVYDTLFEDEERHYSSLAADALGMPIRHLPVDGYGLFERWAGDSLPPEPSTEVLWAVTRDVLAAAGPHSDVALSGDGGDPVLLPGAVVRQAGRVPVAQLAAGAWRTLRRGLWPPLGLRSGLVRRRRTDRIEMPTWLSPRLSRLHDFRSRWEGFYDGLAPLDAPRGEALASLRGQWWAPAFELSDPNTTGVPVEPSYPFFDSRVVSVALSLPSYPWCVNKTVLRDAMSGHLPDAVRLRPKAPLAGDPVASRAWSSAALMQRLRSTPRIDAYVDLAEIERRCTGEGLFSDRQPGTLAVAALATWLRADARSSP